MKVPYVKRPCIIIMLQDGAWPGLVLFGYLNLKQEIVICVPKKTQ
jgi:hypothetical protein